MKKQPKIRGALAALLTFATLPCAAGGDETLPAAAVCEVQTPGGDELNIQCRLESASVARQYRFRANFSGGHDDTKASMTLALGEAPLLCAEGSKTSLFAEDGDVSLECRFSLAAGSQTPRVLKVRVLWSHAQYTDFQLTQDE